MNFGTAKKSSKRVALIDGIMKSITSKHIFGVIGKQKSEQIIATYMHQELRKDIKKLFADLHPYWSEKTALTHADNALLWECDKNTTVNHIQFMGTQHRPDFITKFDDIRIGIEVKRGESGSMIREAIGQCLVYSSEYDFVCCVVVDTSKGEKILHSFEHGIQEKELLERLWNDYNIKMAVV